VQLLPAQAGVTVGQDFTIAVNITNAGGVGSVPFHLAFDPSFLEFRNFSNNSPFLGQDGAPVFVLATVGAGGREVIVGLSRQGTRPGVDGSGTLIILSFRALRPGTTSLSFSDLSVLDPKAEPLPADRRGATVLIRPAEGSAGDAAAGPPGT
jgi:general secretion pathway protein D